LIKLRTRGLIRRCQQLRGYPNHDLETTEMIVVLRRLARRISDLETEAREHETALRRLVASWRPDLLDQPGVSPS
jgi:transposase